MKNLSPQHIAALGILTVIAGFVISADHTTKLRGDLKVEMTTTAPIPTVCGDGQCDTNEVDNCEADCGPATEPGDTGGTGGDGDEGACCYIDVHGVPGCMVVPSSVLEICDVTDLTDPDAPLGLDPSVSNFSFHSEASTCPTNLSIRNEEENICAGILPPPEGACCNDDGTCAMRAEGNCAGNDRLGNPRWRGVAYTCDLLPAAPDPLACPEPPQYACCKGGADPYCDILEGDPSSTVTEDCPDGYYEGINYTDPTLSCSDLIADGTCSLLGACCTADTCLQTTERDCTEREGNWQQDTPCPTNDAGGIISCGACCHDGKCSQKLAGQCTGTHQGAGIACPEDGKCGACCSGTYCTDTVESECSKSYLGDETTCPESGRCGACCEYYRCELSIENECSGNFSETEVCPLDESGDPAGCGACCTSGSCEEHGYIEQGCTEIEGVFTGEGTQCTEHLCDLGACCTSNSCNTGLSNTEQVTRYECGSTASPPTNNDGFFENESCSNINNCNWHTVACCYESHCDNVGPEHPNQGTRSAKTICEYGGYDVYGRYHQGGGTAGPDGSRCDGSMCPLARSCCTQATGVCRDVSQIECGEGRYTMELMCDRAACPYCPSDIPEIVYLPNSATVDVDQSFQWHSVTSNPPVGEAWLTSQAYLEELYQSFGSGQPTATELAITQSPQRNTQARAYVGNWCRNNLSSLVPDCGVGCRRNGLQGDIRPLSGYTYYVRLQDKPLNAAQQNAVSQGGGSASCEYRKYWRFQSIYEAGAENCIDPNHPDSANYPRSWQEWQSIDANGNITNGPAADPNVAAPTTGLRNCLLQVTACKKQLIYEGECGLRVSCTANVPST